MTTHLANGGPPPPPTDDDDTDERVSRLEQWRREDRELLEDTHAAVRRLDAGMGALPNPLGATPAERDGHGVLAFVAKEAASRAFATRLMGIAKATAAVVGALSVAFAFVIGVLKVAGVVK